MKIFYQVLSLLYLTYVHCGQLLAKDSQALISFSSNKAEKTYYQFQFTPSTSIESNAIIQIIFPQDFDQVSFPKQLECSIRKGDFEPFQPIICSMLQQGEIKLTVNQISVEQITVIVGQITNPRFADTSSQFRIRTYFNNLIIDSNDLFGFVTFANQPIEIHQPNVFKISNSKINEGSSWEFHFTPQKQYPEGNSFRFTFPDGFRTNKSLCNIEGLTGKDPKAFVLFNMRTIACQGIQKVIHGKQIVRVINMKNPDFSGLMQGFTIEILQGSSQVVLEKVIFPGNIIIAPGELKVNYTSENNFKFSNTTYSFFVNLINPVYKNDKMFINFTNDWSLPSQNCQIINGFQITNDEEVRCSLIPNTKSYLIDNFSNLDSTRRLVFSILLETPKIENFYPVIISTYNSKRNSFVDLNTVMVKVNATFGRLTKFVAHPLKSPQLSLAGKVGSLELTFFLKTFLPKTDVDSFGKIRIDIFPKIPRPDSLIYGDVECFFYSETPSYNACKKPDSFIELNDRTVIYIQTPYGYSYKESEVPITITTAGKDTEYYKGFKLDDLIQRYYFHVHIWGRQNTGSNPPAPNDKPNILIPKPNNEFDNDAPDEVYFGEFIPHYREVDGAPDPDFSKKELPNKPRYPEAPKLVTSAYQSEANSFTLIKLKYIHKDNAISSYQIRKPSLRNYIIRIYFKEGFEDGLGYKHMITTTDKVIKNYPCSLRGTIVSQSHSTTPISSCDLFIGEPFQFLQINQLPTENFKIDSDLEIHIPRILITSNVEAKAMVSLDLIEETPGYTDPTVILYRSTDRQLFTVLPPSKIKLEKGKLSVISSVVLNEDTSYQLEFDQSDPNIDAVAIDWNPNLKVVFGEQQCSIGSGDAACIIFPQPVNWVFAYGTELAKQKFQIKLNKGTTHNVPHQNVLSFSASAFSKTKMITKIVDGAVDYPPDPFAASSFKSSAFNTDFLYQGLATLQEISLTLSQPVPDGWYLQINLLDGMKVNKDRYFRIQSENTEIVSLDSRGVMFEIQNSGQTFVLYNLKGVDKGKVIFITLSITLPYQSTCTGEIEVYTQYQYGFSTKIINQNKHLKHSSAPFNLSLKSFKNVQIMNPIREQTIVEPKYTGPFDFKFEPKNDLEVNTHLYFQWEKKTATQEGFQFQKMNPTNQQYIYLICSINERNHLCEPIDTDTFYIKVQITLLAKLSKGKQYSFSITTDLPNPKRGLIFPEKPGYYQFKISSSDAAEFTSFIFIRPYDFEDQYMNSGNLIENLSTLFEFDFIPTQDVNSYSNGGHITIFFPTYQDGQAIFPQDLGILRGRQPGCWFGGEFKKEPSAFKIDCEIRYSGQGFDDQYAARIELINFSQLKKGSAYKLVIGGIKNPIKSSDTLPGNIMVLTYNIDSSSNTITYLNSFIRNMFTIYPSQPPTPDYQNQESTLTGIVQDETNKILTHFIKYSQEMKAGDFFITDLSDNERIQSLVENNTPERNIDNIKICSGTDFEYCIFLDNTRWVVWKLKKDIPASTQVSADIPLIEQPISIHPIDQHFTSIPLINQKQVGFIDEKISQSHWKTRIGTITNISQETINQNEFYLNKREYSDVIIKFTTQNMIPATGYIEIIFEDLTIVVNDHCISHIALGSKLESASNSDNTNQVGCQQFSSSKNIWHITSFKQLPKASLVIIQGQITLPTINSSFKVTINTYSHFDQTIQLKNMIDSGNIANGITVINKPSFEFNQQMLLLQSKQLKSTAETAPYQVLITSGRDLTGLFEISFGRQKSVGVTSSSDGFQSMNNLKDVLIGYAENIKSKRITPFVFKLYSEDSDYITIQFFIYETLSANTDYMINITTQQLNSQNVDGLKWPSSPGMFTAELKFKDSQVYQTDYIEVYGAQFASLKFVSTNNRKGENNLIYIEFSLPTQLQKADILIIDFNTQSLDQIPLFENNLGFNQITNEEILTDSYDKLQDCDCRLYHGFKDLGASARIGCSNFQFSSSGAYYKIFFPITNPIVAEDTVIPIQIYILQTPNASDYTKQYSQMLENSFIIKSIPSPSQSVAKITRNSDIMGDQNVEFKIIIPVALKTGDVFVIDYPLPMIGGRNSRSGGCDKGTFFYMSSNKKVACILSQDITVNTQVTLLYFYNPFLNLTPDFLNLKATVTAISDSSLSTTKIDYQTMDQLKPYTDVKAIKKFTTTVLYSKNKKQYTDLKYYIEFDSFYQDFATLYLYTKMNDQGFQSNFECTYSYPSTVSAISCLKESNKLKLKLAPQISYPLPALSVLTKNLAYTVQSNTAETIPYKIEIKNKFDQLILTVDGSTTINFTEPSDNNIKNASMFSRENLFVPLERFTDQIPFYINNNGDKTGPIIFEMYFKTGISQGSDIKFTFPSFLEAVGGATLSEVNESDYFKYTLICKINDVLQSSCKLSSYTVIVTLDQTINANIQNVFFFNVIDQTTYPNRQGFYWKNKQENDQTFGRIQIEYPGSIFQFSDLIFFAKNKGISGNSISTVGNSYSHQIPSEKNLLQLDIQFTDTNYKQIVIEFNSFTKNGNPIFKSNTMHSLKTGDLFPCSSNVYSSQLTCWIEEAKIDSNSKIATNLRVFVNINSVTSNLKLNLLIENPQAAGLEFGLNIKALQGNQIYSSTAIAGYWEIPLIFITEAMSCSNSAGLIQNPKLIRYSNSYTGYKFFYDKSNNVKNLLFFVSVYSCKLNIDDLNNQQIIFIQGGKQYVVYWENNPNFSNPGNTDGYYEYKMIKCQPSIQMTFYQTTSNTCMFTIQKNIDNSFDPISNAFYTGGWNEVDSASQPISFVRFTANIYSGFDFYVERNINLYMIINFRSVSYFNNCIVREGFLDFDGNDNPSLVKCEVTGSYTVRISEFQRVRSGSLILTLITPTGLKQTLGYYDISLFVEGTNEQIAFANNILTSNNANPNIDLRQKLTNMDRPYSFNKVESSSYVFSGCFKIYKKIRIDSGWKSYIILSFSDENSTKIYPQSCEHLQTQFFYSPDPRSSYKKCSVSSDQSIIEYEWGSDVSDNWVPESNEYWCLAVKIKFGYNSLQLSSGRRSVYLNSNVIIMNDRDSSLINIANFQTMINQFISNLDYYTPSISFTSLVLGSVSELRISIGYLMVSIDVQDYILISFDNIPYSQNIIKYTTKHIEQIECKCIINNNIEYLTLCYKKGNTIQLFVQNQINYSDSLKCYVPQFILPSTSTLFARVSVMSGIAEINKIAVQYYPNQSYDLSRTMGQLGFFQTTIGLASPISGTSFTTSVSPTTLFVKDLTNYQISVSGSFTTGYYIVAEFDTIYKGEYALQPFSCSSFSLASCRVYYNYINQIVIQIMSPTSIVQIPFNNQYINRLNKAKELDNYSFFVYVIKDNVIQNPNSNKFKFNQIQYKSNVLTTNINNFALYPQVNGAQTYLHGSFTIPMSLQEPPVLAIYPSDYSQLEIKNCIAYIATTKSLIFNCKISSSKAYIYYSHSKNEAITFILTVQVKSSTNLSLKADLYSQYTDDNNYSKIQEYLFNFNKQYDFQVSDKASFRMVQFKPIITATNTDISTQATPIRINFQSDIEVSKTNLNKIELIINNQFGKPITFKNSNKQNIINSQALYCLYRKKGNYGSYQDIIAQNCEFYIVDSTKSKIVISHPLYGSISEDKIEKNVLYELIINPINPMHQITGIILDPINTPEILNYGFYIDSLSGNVYSETQQQYSHYTPITLNSVYFTSQTKNTFTSLFLKISNLATMNSNNMNSLEITVLNHGSTAFIQESSNGDSIPCDAQIVSKSSPIPYCQTFKRGKDLVIKVLNYGNTASNNILTIAIDDLKLITPSTVADSFSLSFEQIAYYDNYQIITNQMKLENLFIYKTASGSVTQQDMPMVLSSNFYGEDSITMFANPSIIQQISANTQQFKPNKVRLQFKNGYFSGNQRNLILDESTYQVFEDDNKKYIRLWVNAKTNSFYGQPNSANLNQIKPQIKGLENPTLLDRLIFEDNPIIVFTYYKQYLESSRQNAKIPKLVGPTDYTHYTDKFPITTQILSTNVPLNGSIWVKIVLKIRDNAKTIKACLNTQKNDVLYMDLTAISGFDRFDECINVFNNVDWLLPCSVQANNVIRIGYQKRSNCYGEWTVLVRARLTAFTNQFQVETKESMPNYEITVWKFTADPFTNIPPSSNLLSGQALTKFIPPISKYFTNYFERYIKYIVPGFNNVQSANFEIRTTNSINNSGKIEIEFKEYAKPIVDPTDKTLVCFWMKKESTFSFGLPKMIKCTHSNGKYEFMPSSTTSPVIPASITILLQVKYENSVSLTTFNKVFGQPQRQEISLAINSSDRDSTYVELKNTLNRLIVTPYTHTADQRGYIEFDIAVKDNVEENSQTIQTVVQLEFNNNYYPDDFGLTELYDLRGVKFATGKMHDIKGEGSIFDKVSANFLMGDTSRNIASRISIVGYKKLTASMSTFKIKIPLIQNGNNNKNIMFTFRTIEWRDTVKYPLILNEQLYIRNNIFEINSIQQCSYSTLSTQNEIQTTNGIINLVLNNVGSLNKNKGGLIMFQPLPELNFYDLKNWAQKTFTSLVVSSVEQYPITKVIVVKINQDITGSVNLSAQNFIPIDESLEFGFQFFIFQSDLQTVSQCDLSANTLRTKFKHFKSALSTPKLTEIVLGQTNEQSYSVLKLQFKVRKLPFMSTIKIAADKCTFTNYFLHQIAYQNGQSLPLNPVLQPNNYNKEIDITGFGELISGSEIMIKLGIQMKNTDCNFYYSSKGPGQGYIEEFSVGFIKLSGIENIKFFQMSKEVLRYIGKGESGPIQLRYELDLHEINYADRDSLHLKLPLDTDEFSLPTKITYDVKYQKQGNSYHITPINKSKNPFEIYSPLTLHDMTPGNMYSMILNIRLTKPDDPNGYKYPANFGYYRFLLNGMDSNGKSQQFGYDNFLLAPEPQSNLLKIHAICKQPAHNTVIRIKWEIIEEAKPDDEIWIELQANNSNYIDNDKYQNNDKGFDNDLGTGSIDKILDCVEANNVMKISDNKLFCNLMQIGDDNKIFPNEIRPVIRILVTKIILPKTNVDFFISGFKNPKYGLRRVTLTISLRRSAPQSLYSKVEKIPLQISMGEYYTSQHTLFYQPQYGQTEVQYKKQVPADSHIPIRQVTFSATGKVWDIDQKQTHTWNILSEADFSNDDWVLIKYTLENNSKMSDICSTIGSECVVFKSLGLVIAKLTGLNVSDKFVTVIINEQNNGLFRYYSEFFVEHYDYTGTLKTAYMVDGLVYNYDELDIEITIKPGSTPQEESLIDKYWLTDFMNVARFRLKNMWKHHNIKHFWIQKQSTHDFFQTKEFVVSERIDGDANSGSGNIDDGNGDDNNYRRYCNATLIVEDPAVMNPYPWRFHCWVKNANLIYIELTNDFPEYKELDATAYQKIKDIVVYVNLWINEFTNEGTSSVFTFYGMAEPHFTKDERFGVTRKKQFISVSPYLQPDLRNVAFNQVSFKDRKASSFDKVEFYMLVQPQTKLSLHRIDKMIFRIPNEFEYSPIKYLDACSMVGKAKTPIESCELQRKYGETFVTLIPKANTYDNSVKIIRLGDPLNQNLFGTPRLPGDFYNITVSLYSKQTLLEVHNINITRVLGFPFSPNTVQIISQKDSVRQGFFEFQFQVGSEYIDPGYNSIAAKIYTSIELTFDNSPKLFTNDLGTRLRSGDELACVSVGLQFTSQEKIKCLLHVGTGPYDQPRINIYNYDRIYPGQLVKLYFSQIQTADANAIAYVKVAIRAFYNWINYSANFYEPYNYQAGLTSDIQVSSSVNGQEPKVSSEVKVGEKRSYEFQFILSEDLKTTDYLDFQFPEDYFNKFYDYSDVKILGFDKIKVLGLSNHIYASSSTQISKGTIDIKIQNLINPSYSQINPVTIEIFSLIDMKIKDWMSYELKGAILPCNSFLKAQAISNTSAGEESNAQIRVEFITGHEVPFKNGAISVQMPLEYKFNFYEMNAGCQLIGFGQKATCEIGAPNRMDIFLNGSKLDKLTQYGIQINGINTIIAAPQQYKIDLSSYYHDNIALNRKICTQQTDFPTFSQIEKVKCESLLELDTLNASAKSLYTFKFQCNSIIRKDTTIDIILPQELQSTNQINKINCFSLETMTLSSSQCSLQLDQSNRYILRAKLQMIQSLQLFSVQVYLFNPKQSLLQSRKLFSISAIFYIYQLQYATSTQSNQIQYAQQIPRPIQGESNQITLTNIPKNAGQSSTYTFTIPPLINRKREQVDEVTIVKIQFPDANNDFASNIGKDLQCGLYLNEQYDMSFLTYSGLLTLISNENNQYMNISCKVQGQYLLVLDVSSISKENKLKISSKWQHWVVQNVVNPKEYNPHNQFELIYLSSNFEIKWHITKTLIYQITKAPQYIRVDSAQVINNNIRVPTTYKFSLQSQYQLPDNPLIGISIQLPWKLYSTVETLYMKKQLEYCTLSTSQNKKSITPSCNIYSDKVLIEKANLVGFNSNTFDISIQKLYNPNLENDCRTPNLNYYIINLFDWNTGDILFSTSPSIDDKNCISFSKQAIDIGIMGPLSVYPGISYTYKLTIEKPADNLIIRPISPIAGITFEPEQLQFEDYQSDSSGLIVKIRSDVLPQQYQIKFDYSPIINKAINQEKYEPSILQLDQTAFYNTYLPIIPLNIKVISYNDTPKPQVRIEDVSVDSVGYPIRIPVTLSHPSANAIFLLIKVVQDEFKDIIKITNSLLQINPNVKQTYFEIIVNTKTVPATHATLQFSLTSYYTLVHQLVQTQKHISFSVNRSYSKDYNILSLLFNNVYAETDPQDINQNIIGISVKSNFLENNKETLFAAQSLLTPKVIEIIHNKSTPNTATFTIYTSSACQLYYTYSIYGELQPLNAAQLVKKTYPHGLFFDNLDVKIYVGKNSVVDYITTITIKNLKPQTNYKLYIYLFNTFGTSEMSKFSFKTSKLSFGSTLSFSVTDIVPIKEIINALSKSLHISASQIISKTDIQKLQKEATSIDSAIMVKRNYQYQLIILPNPLNDVVPTAKYIELIKQDEKTRSNIVNLLPQFDIFSQINSAQIIQSIPLIEEEPHITKIDYFNATFTLRLWEKGYVYAVVLETDEVNLQQRIVSSQIFNGLDYKNKPLSNYHKYSVLTDDDGRANIQIDDLHDGIEYSIFFTIGSYLPYKPLNLMEDEDIRVVKFTTPFNINLGDFKDKPSVLEDINPDLADALRRFKLAQQ